jgi:hypothetical protein
MMIVKKLVSPAVMQFEFPADSVSQSKSFAGITSIGNKMDAQHELKLHLCRIETENFPIRIEFCVRRLFSRK